MKDWEGKTASSKEKRIAGDLCSIVKVLGLQEVVSDVLDLL
jgi:hypothetical protein